jgi:hypothetical protein
VDALLLQRTKCGEQRRLAEATAAMGLAHTENHLFRGRTIVLYSAERVGKTTPAKQILARYPDIRSRYLKCDLLSVRRALGLVKE